MRWGITAGQALLPLQLLGQWKFDTGSGISAIDSVYNKHPGTLLGDTLPQWDAGGHSGNCLFFDGSTSYVGLGNVPQFMTQSVGSISLRFKITGSGTWRTLFACSAGTGVKTSDYLVVGINPANKIYLNIRNAAGTDLIYAYPTTGTITEGQWYHVVATMGTGGSQLYINSAPQTLTYGAGTSSTQAWFNSITNTAVTYIGTLMYSGSLIHFAPGYMDEVQLYSTDLSAGQVTDIFNTGKTTFPASLSGVDPTYTLTVGETLSITPVQNGLAGAVTYSCSDSSANWNPATHTWTLAPVFGDGGTIKTIGFAATNGVDTVTASTTVVVFRDFSGLVRSVANPVIPYNVADYNAGGADTPYIRDAQKIAGTYYALTQSATAGTNWVHFSLYTSTNRVTWTPYGSNPVFTVETAGHWDVDYLGHPALLKIGSLWYMYFSAANGSGTEAVGVATSPDLITWTPYVGNPILSTPSVAIVSAIQIGSLYYLYVANRPTGHTITYYTSSDGLAWTYGGIAVNGNDWDVLNSRLNDPWIVQNLSGFYELVYTAEFFSGGPPGCTPQEFGYAVSADGVHWYKYQGTIFKGSGVGGSFDELYVGDPALYFPDSTHVELFYAGVNASYIAQGGVAILSAP